MTTTYSLQSIQHTVDIGITLTKSWFRGHSRIWEDLVPGIFRNRWDNPIQRQFRPEVEFAIVEEFKRQAPSLISAPPSPDDHMGWLFLMQHHGCPTRLLDWSTNVLVALFFAVAGDEDADGELWAMFPQALNTLSGIPGYPLPGNRMLRYMFMEPGFVSDASLLEQLKLEKAPKYPLALFPQLHVSRLVAQQGAFTVHPRPIEGSSIPELLSDENHLVRYIIPAARKRTLRANLAALGITRRTLFPDLDSLARTLIAEQSVLAYSPPRPPRWDVDSGQLPSAT